MLILGVAILIYHKSRREGLTTLAGIMLEVRSANLMELAASLPHEIGTAHDRYQYLERQLKNDKTDVDATIRPYAQQVIERLASSGETVILRMDQSHINEGHEVLMSKKSCWMASRRGCPKVSPSCWRRIAFMARQGSSAGASRPDGLTVFD
jgi:hypothetical protein